LRPFLGTVFSVYSSAHIWGSRRRFPKVRMPRTLGATAPRGSWHYSAIPAADNRERKISSRSIFDDAVMNF
jgi:hypothetical protein